MSCLPVLLPLLLGLPTGAEGPEIPRSEERCSICGAQPILPELEALMFARRPEDQAAILRALGRTHSPLARNTLRSSLTSSSAIVREAAIDGLIDLGVYASTDELLKALDDREGLVVIAAARALGHLPLPRVRTRLSTMAADWRYPGPIRAAAVRSLLLHRTQESWAAATAARLADPSLAQATQAEAQLEPPCEGCNEPRVSQALAELLASAEVTARVDAIALISELRPIRRGLKLLDQIAARDPAPVVRLAALDLIASSTDSAAVPLLVHGADDPEVEVRRKVVQHLATSSRSESLHSMIELSRNAKSADVRSGSTTALVGRSEPEAEARLEEVLREREAPVLRVALLVLSEHELVAPLLVEATMPLALDPNADRDLRSLALTLTARAHQPQIATTLLELAGGEETSLGPLARTLLEANYPEVYAEYQRNLPAPEAKLGFVLSSGVFSGATLSLLGRIRDDSGTATFLTATGGLALGVGAAYLIGGNDDLYGGPVSIYATAGSWGLLTGLSVPMVLGGEAWPTYSRHLGGAIGTTLGTTVGALALHDRDWSIGDAVLINTSGVQAGLGTLGALLVPGRGGDPLRAGGAVLLGGLALGVVPASFFADSVELQARDLGTTFALTGTGAWLGLWGSRMITNSERASQSFGGLLLGQSLGYLSGLLLTQSLTLEHSPFELFLASVAGASFGSGAALLATSQSVRVDATIVELGTVLGALATLHATGRDTDPTTVSLGAAVGAWFGGFAPVAYGAFDRGSMGEEVVGGLMLGGTAGAVLSAIALESPGLNADQQRMAVVGSMGGAAAGAGAVLLVPEAAERTVVQVMLAGTALGLVGGVLGLSRLPVDAGDGAAASVAAGYGALSGLLLGDILSSEEPNSRVRVGGALLTSAGLGGLTLLASDLLEVDPLDAGEAGIYAGVGALAGHGLAGLTGAGQQANAALVLGTGTLALGAGLLSAGATAYDDQATINVAVPTLLGTSLGLSLPYVLRQRPSDRERVAGAELMTGLGFGLGVVLSQSLERPGADGLETAAFSLSGGAVGLGLGLLVPNSSTRTRATLHQAGTLSLGVAAFALAPLTEYDPLESGLIAVTAAQAGWAGLFLPYLWHADQAPPSEQVLGGLLLGTGAGVLGGAILTELFGVHPTDTAEVVELSFTGIAANATGAGLGLLASEDNRVTVAFLESVGLLGSAGLAALAPHTRYSDGDTAFEVLWTAQALWNGAALASLSDATGRQAAGATLVSVGAGGLIGAGLAQVIEPEVPDAMLAFTGSVWGVWLGYFGARLTEQAGATLSNQEVLATTLVASDVGLALTAFALSPLAGMAPEQLGWINVGGLGGGVAGATFGLVAGGPSGVNAGNVIGCAGGLLGTAIVTSLVMDEGEAPAPVPSAPGQPKFDAGPQGQTGGWTLLLPEPREMQVGSLMLPPRLEGDPAPLGLGISGKLY